MMNLTRKLAPAFAVVAAVSLLAGCAAQGTGKDKVDTENESTSQNAKSPENQSSTSAVKEGMRIVETDKGEVEIPENPRTIVSDYYLGEFLAVDVKPAIASPYSLSNPFLSDKVDGIKEMDITSAETSLEMIAAQEPNLIVTITEADYEKYSEIAPTVYIQDGKRSDEDVFRYIADLVGKREEAEAYIAHFNQRVMSVKDEIRGIVGDRTVSIVEVWPQQIYTMGSHFARGGSILYDMWELKAPEAVQTHMVDGDTQYQVVSLEALPEYTGDFIFYGVLADTDSSFVEESQLWNSLDAVKEGRVLPYEQVSFMHRDPITYSAQLDIFIDFFRGFEGK